MTARKFDGTTIVVASHNRGKVREMAELLAPYARHFPSAGELDLAEPDEPGCTFVQNAAIKARAAASASGHPALADDSGLVVPALGGAPGLYSARWAGGGNKDFAGAIERVERELGASADRRAHFVAAIALAWPDGHVEAVEGRVDGTLTFPPRGQKGFGFDPIFVADGHALTFAEMDPVAKHAISHRAVAFRKLVTRCFG
ncbi:MAG: rdgB [Rhodospirillales bacterium]|nr:rdgB [Rhodospirillales bacterium]